MSSLGGIFYSQLLADVVWGLRKQLVHSAIVNKCCNGSFRISHLQERKCTYALCGRLLIISSNDDYSCVDLKPWQLVYLFSDPEGFMCNMAGYINALCLN